MIGSFLRLAWRAFVGLIALIMATLTTVVIFPYLDNHMPVWLVIVILYGAAAYVGVPALVRLWRLVLKPDHLPVYATSTDGWSSDPVNVAIVCKTRGDLVRAMKKAGWHEADRVTVRTAARLAYAIVFNQPYPNAPFSSLYLFGRRQDIGFQIQTGNPATPRHRHHIRFWQLDTEDESTHKHVGFWQSALAIFTRKKRQIWIGAATHDIAPFAIRIQNLQVTHKIDPDTNRERDYVIGTLESSKLVKRIETITTGEPLKFRGQTFGVNIVVDGKLKVVELNR